MPCPFKQQLLCSLQLCQHRHLARKAGLESLPHAPQQPQLQPADTQTIDGQAAETQNLPGRTYQSSLLCSASSLSFCYYVVTKPAAITQSNEQIRPQSKSAKNNTKSLRLF